MTIYTLIQCCGEVNDKMVGVIEKCQECGRPFDVINSEWTAIAILGAFILPWFAIGFFTYYWELAMEKRDKRRKNLRGNEGES